MTEKTYLVTGNAAEMQRQLGDVTFKPTPCPEVTHSNQIKDLPWKGNFASDSLIFDAIDTYIWLPTTSMTERMAAMYAMGFYGMGVDQEMTIKMLAEYMYDAAHANKLPYNIMLEYLSQIRKHVPLTYPVEQGQKVVLFSTGEGGYVLSGGKDASDPLIVNMGRNSPFPACRHDNHADLLKEVFVNPDEKATDE